MSRWTTTALLALLLSSSALAAEKPLFIYSATFAYYDYPKDLWPTRLTRLKSMGFNTVQIQLPHGTESRPSGSGSDLLEVLRLARQLGLHVWVEGKSSPPELESFTTSRGGPILDHLSGKALQWFPPEDTILTRRRLLYPNDLTSLRGLLKKQGPAPPVISAFDAGWAIGDDTGALPSDPSNYLLASRELLAAGVKAFNCSAVLEGRDPPDREAALSFNGDSRPQAAVFSRNGALLAQFGRLLTAMRSPAGTSVRWVLPPKQKPFPLLRLGMLVSTTSRGPALVSALNYSDSRPVTGTLAAVDPRTGKEVLLRGLNLPPRQALLMPVNLALAQPEVCAGCSAFAPDERLVWATAELLSVSFENGVLAMEFVAPGEGELALELARRPEGPLIAGARIRQFDWDEKTHRLHLRIPAGRPPDFRSRVGLAIQLPETSVFLKVPRRFIIGSTAQITATLSSPELAARSRLLTPPGWRVKAESQSATQIDYSLEIPGDAIPDDTVTLAIETEGKIAQSATAPLAPFCSARIEPAEALHPRRGALLPVRPYLAPLLLPGRHTYRLYIRNNNDEIKTFQVAAAGPGLRFSPAREEVSIGANLEREVTLWAAAEAPGLYPWSLEIHEGHRKLEIPLVLAVLQAGESLAYEFDLDRDGFPELVLENQRLRVAVSPHSGGRVMEFLLKQRVLNAFTGSGALDSGGAWQGQVAGPGQIELRSEGMVRRLSLGGRDSFFEVEQIGGPAEWTLSIPSDLDSSGGLFSIHAPDARMETDRKPFSTQIRLRFPEGGPRRARFTLDPRP